MRAPKTNGFVTGMMTTIMITKTLPGGATGGA